jgi:hypothetical protein
MKKTLIRLSVLILLVLSTCAGIYYYVFRKTATDTNDFVLALRDKSVLMENTPSPRIVFVGGSNLIFGIDSRKVEQKTGLKVVNMSLLAGYGLTFMINAAKPYVKQGDIIFISFEYYLGEGEMDLLAHTVDMVPEARSFLNDHEKLLYPWAEANLRLQHLIRDLQKIARFNTGSVEKIYTRNGFNSNGDVISHLDKPNPKTMGRRYKIEQTDYSKYIAFINEFAAYARNKGAKVFYLYPVYVHSEFIKYHDAIIAYDREMRESLKIPIVNNIDTFVFDDQYFFDTVYHTNKQGRDKRTDKLLEIIVNLLPELGGTRS